MPGETLPAGRKMPKDRITLLACANATGTDRVKLLTIGKAENPRCFSRINRQALGCEYMHSKKAWMTSNLFRDWFYKHFVPHMTSYLRKRGLPAKAVLLVDNAAVHDKIQQGDIRVEFLPPNTTALIQSMDQGPIAALKKRYMTNFLLHVMSRDEHETAKAKIKCRTIKDAITMIGSCWAKLSEQTLRNAWKNLLQEHAENVQLEILEDELVRDDLNTGSAGDNPDLDLLDDFEAEISSWEEVNELVETYHVPTVEEIIHNVAVGTDMDDSESEDEQLQGESECDDDVLDLEVGAAVVGVSEPNDPVKLADIVLVDEIEKLIDQLYLRSWTRAEDTQSVQNILNRAKSYIYYDKKKQTAITDYVTRNCLIMIGFNYFIYLRKCFTELELTRKWCTLKINI